MNNTINITLPGLGELPPAKFQVIPADWLAEGKLSSVVLEGETIGFIILESGQWVVEHQPDLMEKPTILTKASVKSFTSNHAVAYWACTLLLAYHHKYSAKTMAALVAGVIL